MTAKTYRMLMRVLAIAIAMTVAYSIVAELPFLVPLSVIVAAIVLAIILRHMTREIMVDERVSRIEEKASAMSYRVFTVVAGILTLGLILFRSSLPPALTTVGETLAYTVCGIMLIHLGSRYYYKSKL
jgi:uncharacterized membrane protein